MTMTPASALAFFASVIKSGEPWTPICQQAMDEAMAHLTQPAQACEHDWAVGYGVPAYCNHCGIERDPKPAQSVDVEKVREVIARVAADNQKSALTLGVEGLRGQCIETAKELHKLATALQEKGNG